MRTIIRLMLSVLLLSVSTYTQADEFKDYARRLREEVWNWDKPEFHNYRVPEEYQNESAVVLARHQEIEVRTKKILMVYRLYYTEIDRRMVKINDKVSLEKYSDISFAEKVKMATTGYGQKNQIQTVIGARVVKPDGSVKEVNVDEAVTVTEGKKEKESHRKLAIPDLQVGDIIDYFVCDIITLDEMNPPPVWLTFFSAYPTLSYSARCTFNTKHLTIEYAALNGAKDFKRTELSDEETVLEIKETHLPKVDEGRYIAYLCDTPMIRMHILNNKSRLVGSSANARKPGIYKVGHNLFKKDMIKDAEFRSVNSMFYKQGLKPDYKRWKKYLNNYWKQHPDLTAVEKANYIHAYVKLEWSKGYYYHPYSFMWVFHQLLIDAGVPHEYVLMTNVYGPRMDDLLSSRDLDDAIRVGDKYYTYPYFMRVPGWLYQNNQGQEAWINDRWVAEGNGKVKHDKNFKGEYIVTPTTTAQENKSIQRTNVTLAESNPLELRVDREVTRSGALKRYHQDLLFQYLDWDKEIRQSLSISSTYWDMMKEKYNDKAVQKDRDFLTKRAESMKDSVKVEVTDFHDMEPKEVLSYQVKSMGVTPVKPEFNYIVSYTLEGLVKRAGNNRIVEIGKLIGSQWEPSDDERRRTVGSHIPTQRVYINEIALHIPTGYEALETDKLTMTLDNECGTFRSTASVEGDVLKISTYKEYKQTFIPAEKWPLLIAVMNEAIKFQTLSVVLRKK